MVKENQIIFQVHSTQVICAFESDNYIIEYELQNKDKRLCVIYFSSNEIYYPNTASSFQYSIIEKDRYEWTHNKLKNAYKHIFIRDIQKQWYIGGINTRLNSPEKLLSFLQTETEGFLVYLVGSSAGGYAALLYGNLLKAKRVYAFNAQLNLFETIRTSKPNIDPLLFENINNSDLNKYFNLSDYLINGVNNYYFQSCLSEIDVLQYESLSSNAKNKLKTIFFLTSHHGIPFLKVNIPYIFEFDEIKLDKLVDKKLNLILFSFNIIGIFPTLTFILNTLISKYKKNQLIKKLK